MRTIYFHYYALILLVLKHCVHLLMPFPWLCLLFSQLCWSSSFAFLRFWCHFFFLHEARWTVCNFSSLNKAIRVNVLYTSQISYPTFLQVMYSWQYFFSVNILMSIIKLLQNLNFEKILLFLHTFSYIFKILLML